MAETHTQTTPEVAKRGTPPEVCKTKDEAIKIATSRVKGPRRAFELDFKGAKHFVVAHNPHQAGGFLLEKVLGAKIEEVGRPARGPRVPSADGFVAALSELPQEEQAKVLAQLESLKKAQANAKK